MGAMSDILCKLLESFSYMYLISTCRMLRNVSWHQMAIFNEKKTTTKNENRNKQASFTIHWNVCEKKQLQIYDRYMRVLKHTKTITRFKRGT